MAKKVVSKKKVSKVSSSNSSKREVNWIAALLLSIFLGYLGIDRFFMGFIGTGILKLLITIFTLGIFGWIWWIIDIILIATKYQFPNISWVE